MSAHERDLFRAIVVAGAAVVGSVAGCSSPSAPPVDAASTADAGSDAAPSNDAGSDAGALLADAGSDTGPVTDAGNVADAGADAGEDAFVVIL